MIRRRFLPIFCILVVALAGCATVPSNPGGNAMMTAGGLEGKLTHEDAPLTGGRVLAWPADAVDLAGPAPFQSGPTGPDGRYRLELPPGEYFVLARGSGVFTYYGRNPVSVPAGEPLGLNLALVAAEAEPPSGEPFVAGGVFGAASYLGAALEGVIVYVYLDLSSGLKGMGYIMSRPTDAEGRFEVELPAGTYYLLARKRQSGSAVGPLGAGDHIGYYPGNPVRLGEQQVVRLGIPMLEVPDKLASRAAALGGATRLGGVVRDSEGRPLEGLRAVLYDDPQMFNRPLYVSAPTGVDGRFVLSFPGGGTFYLAARDSLGGAPGPGDLYGTYDATADHAVTIEAGEHRDDLEIIVREMW